MVKNLGTPTEVMLAEFGSQNSFKIQGAKCFNAFVSSLLTLFNIVNIVN